MDNILVGIIEPIGGHGGMDYYDYGLAMGLGISDVNVILYTSDVTLIRNYTNVKTFYFFNDIWNRNFIIKVYKYLLGHYLAINDLKKKDGKIIHLHFFTFRSIDLLILCYAKIRGFKNVVTVHDVNSFHKKANSLIEQFCLCFVDGIIVHNQSSLNALTKKHKKEIPIRVIPHGNYLPFINKTIFHKVDDNDNLKLLFFGQIKEIKGLDILLEALSILKKNKYKIQLSIAGKIWKSNENVYKDLILKLDIEDIVKTKFSYIPDEEVFSYYNEADLVVLPYKSIYQSGVLLLTLSYGKPVICSDLEPFKEIVVHNKTGFLFERENAVDLANKIQEIANKRNILKEVVHNTETLINDKFDWTKIGSSTKKFYLDITKDKS